MAHFPIKLLVKAESRKQAIERAESFLKRYELREWDYYLFGGRFAWADLLEKHKDYISRPDKLESGQEVRVYWNPYHDEEVKGKTVRITFPDGSTEEAMYGMDVEYAIKRWIDEHAEQSEVMDATHPDFWREILSSIAGTKNALDWYRRILQEFMGKEGLSLEDLVWGRRKPEFFLIPFWLRRIAEMIDPHVWIHDKLFFDVEHECDSLTPETKAEIERDKTRWFLVNIDLHS